ncbi:MAG: FadR family transcriptional regulator [Dehalobacter sp.]|nr:FadR family transcriptional regulator [Dehalobacter sp.]
MFNSAIQEKRSMHIVRQVRQAIMNGDLKPGHRLPNESELILQFGVSKHTLREALRALESMGFIEIRQGAGGGPVICEIDMDNTRDMIASFLYFKNVSVKDLCEVRKIFEPYLARLAAEQMAPEDIEKMKTLQEVYGKSIKRNKPAIKEEVAFHTILAQTSGNPVMILILDFVNSLLTDLKNHIKPGLDFSERVFAAHERVVEAIAARNGQAAADAMYNHICEVEENLENLKSHDEDQTVSKAKLRNLK